MKIGILNIGGNLSSVWYAVERLGHKASLITRIRGQDAVIIPGQGRFDVALQRVTASMKEEILGFKGPVIGICLGMQLLFSASEEGEGSGLGIFSGKLIRLPSTSAVPHIGWSKCSNEKYYYFAHSYYIPSNGQNFKDLVCNYNGVNFVASCRRNNFVGCQFHPEKSGAAGAEFLKKALN